MKKKLFVIFVCLLLSTSLIIIVLPAETDPFTKEITESFLFSEPNFEEKNEFLMLRLDEAPTCLMNSGEPMIPTFTKIFKFPFKTQIKKVICSPSQIKKEVILKEIQPSPKPILLNNDQRRNTQELIDSSFFKDSTIYNSQDFYPDTWYDYNIGCGLENSEHVVILTVRFYPIRYSPYQNKRTEYSV